MISVNKILCICVMSFVLGVSSLLASSPDESFLKVNKLSDISFLNLQNSKAKPVFDFNSSERFDDERLIGSWQIRYRLGNQCNATMEFSFGADGDYTSRNACEDGSIPFEAVGNWSLVRQGVVKVEFSDWEPKYGAMGQAIQFPRVQTMQYKFINDNRMTFTGRTANRIE